MLAFALVFAAALVAIGGTSGMHDLQFSFDAGMAYASNNAYPRSTVEINDGTANGPVLSNRDNFGMSVAAIGDLDGDGVPDLAAGASGDDNGGPDRGAVHVMFMNRDGTIRDTVEINSGTANGPVLSTGDRFGVSVVAIGDLDGDGVPDLVVGAYGEDNPGENSGAVHVMFMNRDGTVKDTVVINEGTANGPVLSDSDDFGISVAAIDDLDGDGVPDLVVGANGDRGAGPNSGAVRVMFMNRDGTVKDTVKINSGTANGPVLSAADGFGISVAAIDDLDGDGVPDIAAGAWYDRNSGPDRGAVHVMFMNRDGTVKDTVEINSGTANGPVLSNSDHFGVSVAAIGDFDGDGVPDLAAGAWSDDNGGPDRGAVHVMFMNRDGTVKDTVEINSGTANGPVLSNRDHFGVSVAAIGDFDGDGVPDLAAGALNDDNGGPDRGAVHIIYINDMITNGNGTMPLDAVDTSSPAPVISSSAQGHTNAYSIDFTVDFGEPVDPATFTSSDVHASGGTVSDPLPVNGTTMFVFTISDLAAGNLTVHVPEGGILDPAGNGNTASDPYVIKVDWTHPSPSIYTAATSPVNASSIDFTVDFGEPVDPETFTSSDVHASGGTVSDPLPVNGTTMFVFTISDLAAGNLTVHVPEGGILDPAGNGNTASDPYVIEVERPRPSPSIYIAARSVNTLSIDFTVDFGEPVDPETFTSSDVHASGGTVSDPLPVNGTTMFVFTVSDLAAGNLTVHVPEGGILDPAGNGNTASDPYVIKVDWTHPSPSIYTAATSPVNASSIDFTVDFGEPVDPATFTSSDVHASGGTVSDPLPVNGTTMFVFTVSDLAAGNLTVHVPEGGILDPAGNGNTASNSLTLAVIHFPAGTAPDAGFVTTWKTTTANEEIMIPTDGMGGSYTVTWGDASISTHVVGDQTHVYKEPGTYLVSIYGDFTRIYLPYHPENSLKLLSIEQWGDIRWESMRGAFNGATNMVYRATDTPNLSAVTDTSEMLRFALRFNGNLSNWDVSSVTDMSDMFSIAGAFNGDISTWNVSSVTDMSNMFLATNSFDQNLGNWYVVLHDTSISGANEKLAISAQNAYLDGQNPTYAVDDPRFVVTGGALAIKPGLSVPPGSYEVTVTSTGGFGQGNSKKVEISVGAAQANNPPTVDAGQDQTVDEGDAVTLSGTASDPEGDQLTYLWSHDSALSITVSNATSQLTTFTAPAVDSDVTVTFVLSVSDGTNTDVTDQVAITIQDVPTNNPPTVDAGQDRAVNEGDAVTLSGTASDLEGGQLTYLWSHDSALPITVSNATSQLTTFTAPAVNSDATVTFVLSVSDGTNTDVTDQVTITIQDVPINNPPTVDAGQDQTVDEGDAVTLSGTASDPEGDQLTYLWSHDSALSITVSNATSQLTTFTAPAVDSDVTVTFVLSVSDGTNTDVTDHVTVTIQDVPANNPPTVDAGQDRAVNEGDTLTLNGTASDADGDALTYLWSHDSDLEIILDNPSSVSVSFTVPQVTSNATITFTMTVTDKHNSTGSDAVVISILDIPADDSQDPIAYQFQTNTVVWNMSDPHDSRDISRITLSSVTSGIIHATWEIPNEAPANYRISWAKAGESYLTWTDLTGNAFPTDPSHTITGLRDGEAYKVKVRASYAGTSGDWSDDVTITVTETVSNTPATGLPVIGGTVQVGQTLTVDTSGIADMNGMVNATLSYQWVSSDGATDTDIAEATTSRYVLTDGDQGRVIKVQVTFTDDAGHAESRTSDTTLTVAPASTVPGIPTGLNVLQGNSGTLNVSWQIPISDGGSAITGYTIQWKAASGNWTVPADVSEATATGTTHTITGLTDGTPYTVRIIATNHVGDGEPTPESTATPMTSQQLGPRDIGRVTLSSTTPGAIDASWVAPTETPAAYRVSWANVGGSYKTWTDLSGNAFPTATSQTITGLEEGEAYKVKVRATYAGTSGDWSGDVISTVTETVTNTLTIGPPAVQIGDDQTVGEGDTVRLSGSATDPDDDPITYTWSQTDPTTPLITFANASAPSTTFTAPSVTGDTVFTLVLTADDGTYSATDTLSITVKETGTAFITTWTASDSDRSITLPMEGTYSILWGDGSHADVSGSQSHTYGTVGNYTVTVLGDGLESSNLRNDTVNALQLRSIEQWGSTEWTSMDRAFYGAKNMVYRATDVPDLSRVTDTTYMFFNATSFDGDLSSWDVSGVTKMSGMFSDTTSFNGDISSWDVSRVTDMDSMFLSAASFNSDLSSWNVSGVTDMDSMFFETRSFNGDLSAWDVSGVTEMFAMFHDATSFNGDISAWDVSGVTDMSAMFHGATSFNGDLSAWDVSGVTDMSTMFHEASRFNGDLSAWNVSGVTDMNTMFDRAISFNGDLSAWDVSKVTDMNAMFYRATSFNGNLSSWDVSKVIKMIYMFRGATSFNGDISSWDVSGVTDMSGMFHGATSFNGDISSWDVSGVTDMSGMFHGATSFNQNLGAWYIVLDGDTMPSSTDSIGIAAQNLMLNGQNPVYTIDEAATNGDKFRIANGTHLTLRADQTVVQGQYNVTIKSTGSFGVDNSRIVEITVSEDAVPQTNNPPSVEAGQTQVVPEGSKVHLKGSATDPDGDQITYSWSHDSTQDISLANASAPSTTFTAPQVTGDTVFTLVLTANDGTYSATDTLNVTVKETGTAFITTWAASDSDRSITLPIKGAYSILWGDGTYSANVGGHQSHTYGAAGTYTVTVLGEGLERIRLYDDSANARQLGSIEQWGDTKWISMYESFYGAVNMVYRATDAPNLSRVTDMNRMFAGATAINGDLSGWDVSSVTDMSSMFYTAYAFNGDLSGWDVSSVTTMRYMFFGAHAFNGDLSGWDVSSVTTMNGMFASAHVFNGNLSGWDVSSVTDMGSMFYEAVIFSQPLDGWDVSSVTDMDGMFHSAYTFNQSLDDWDVSSVTYMRNMFYDTVAFNQNLGTWYIVPAGTDFDAGDNSLIVTTVSAQNLYLGDHNLTYGIGSGGDSDLFEMTGSTLAFKSAPNAGSYTVKVTASGNDVFENGNNWRMLEITVHDSADG